MDDDVAALYDAWAADYHAAHADWDAAIARHGAALRDVLSTCDIWPPARVLDCTAGIGTQALGLADAGFAVSASDLSPVQIRRLQHEADARGLMIGAAVADLLQLSTTLPRTSSWNGFDVVLTANSLTHLTSDAALVTAFSEMAAVCRPGGRVVVSNRDYDVLGESRPTATPVQRSLDDDGTERLSFQLWDWDHDGNGYRMEDVLVVRQDTSGEWTARSRSTSLQAWRRADIDRAAHAAGLVEPTWHEGHWQPIATYRVGDR